MLEILVVVAIIALLTAILLPSIKKVRQQAREVKCQSNLRQIASAWQMYLQDSKGRFLRGPNMEYNYGGQVGYGSPTRYGADPTDRIEKPLNRYLKMPLVVEHDAEVFECPDDRGTSGEMGVRPSAIYYYGTSYYPNHLILGQNSFNTPEGTPCMEVWEKVKTRIAGVTRDTIESQAGLMLIGDFTWLDNWDPSPGVREQFPYWHGRKCSHNIAFLDGHVVPVRIRKGISVDDQYTLLPFVDLRKAMVDCQIEIPCP